MLDPKMKPAASLTALTIAALVVPRACEQSEFKRQFVHLVVNKLTYLLTLPCMAHFYVRIRLPNVNSHLARKNPSELGIELAVQEKLIPQIRIYYFARTKPQANEHLPFL